MMKGEKTVEFRAGPVTVGVSAETPSHPLGGHSDVSAETRGYPLPYNVPAETSAVKTRQHPSQVLLATASSVLV
jgi:hypothetical protein